MAKQYLDLNQSFHVGPRFCELQPLGFGGGGQVCSAVDVECGKSVAIKKIGLANQKSCKIALREVRILRKLQHENIVKIHDVLYPDTEDASHHDGMTGSPAVYIVQELLDTDLRHIIDGGTLTSEHARLFVYQLLRGIKYLHSANVIHRDLKPDNILINLEDLVLKIGDFGMARILDPDYSHKGHLTQNVSTRWYRSPELIFCPSDYTKAIDMWSAGCIFAEMLLGKPLFPGDHDLDQVLLILEMIPVSEADLIEVEDSVPRKMLKNYKGIPRISLDGVLPSVEPDALDLLQAMLTFNHNDRASADEAIGHPYLKLYSCASDEPLEPYPFHVECEVDNLSPVTLRQMIVDEGKAVRESYVQPLNLELSARTDADDDYKQKLEMLNFSSRDNSDLESEEGSVDPDNTALELNQQGRFPFQDNNEKSEREASEKLVEGSKEHKLLLWEQEMAARTSLDEVLEKGSTESDGESSEKSEVEDTKPEKEIKREVSATRPDQVCSLEVESSEKQISESSGKFDENILPLGNDHQETCALQTDIPVKQDCPPSDLSEKAIGDKLQKEKREEFLGNDEMQKPTNADQSVRRKERENKDLFNLDALRSSNNKVLYHEEKTLQQYLEKSSQADYAIANLTKTLKAPQSSTDPQVVESSEPVERSMSPPEVASTQHEANFILQESTDKTLSQPVSISEVLFVDIPRLPSSQSREGDGAVLMQSPRSKGNSSPREKSVRPKKQNWFYLHKESSN